jgi:hypothetical protein
LSRRMIAPRPKSVNDSISKDTYMRHIPERGAIDLFGRIWASWACRARKLQED